VKHYTKFYQIENIKTPHDISSNFKFQIQSEILVDFVDAKQEIVLYRVDPKTVFSVSFFMIIRFRPNADTSFVPKTVVGN